ncbi:flavodoxin domain-containing protein [Actinoplanes solisilvae]|uniref:flavodoxin domain-containing protein n=1 Tax=Actinoplanes solisilvae TaxID=2486853 RepID=UPI0013E32976|nr:flavodoxin domain-containing protein [Actinoplanes solisilvae]
MVVLVACGSTGGGTAELAGWIAEELRDAGFEVRLSAAADVSGAGRYEALVLGSAVYAAGWHPDVRRFVRRHASDFAGKPVWLFSSGPLDTSADDGPLPPGHHAEEALHELGAREHVTFGGRMTAEARGWLGFLARRMARTGRAGDFRNPLRVRGWARDVAAQIRASSPA